LFDLDSSSKSLDQLVFTNKQYKQQVTLGCNSNKDKRKEIVGKVRNLQEYHSSKSDINPNKF
jgi:hypothetical protein